MNFLRFLLLLSLGVWIGSLIFFAAVAQTSFSVLPSPHQAGLVVRGSLIKLHWIGMVSGAVFLVTSMFYERAVLLRARSLAPIAVVLMLVLTSVSQFAIIPKMDRLRASEQELSLPAVNSPVRAQFDSLHAWSVRTENAVLILGIAALYSVARRLAPRA